MARTHAGNWWLLVWMVLVCACGGGGGNPGVGVATVGAGTGTGSLVITLANLPAGVSASVKVSGPGTYSQEVFQPTTLSALVPGNYIVAASSVASGGTTYVPDMASQSVTVAANASANVTISYTVIMPTLALSEVASVDGAVFLGAPANDGRLFIVERSGRVLIVQDGALQATPFLDIRALTSSEGEGGLLSLAFDPDYAANGHFFIYYTDLGHNIVVERRTVSANRALADPASALTIVRIAHPVNLNHFGGLVSFGADGYLYLGSGDGGGAGDPPGNAQNLGVLLGKLLRLDVAGASAAAPYAIPAGNPFTGQAGKRAEIWAYGLRNPWRYAFDAGGLFIADVGQDRREEIDVVPTGQGGLNFGWNVMEGSLCYKPASCSQAGLTLPAFDYDHGAGCSITGGYVYRGKALPELAGHYFYSDYCAGFLKSIVVNGGKLAGQANWPVAATGGVVSFGRDADGELYLVAASGKIYKLVRA
ncbi:MAG: PQQ-dependent sugar dehydrogenase [Pseudomonadota bacterium]